MSNHETGEHPAGDSPSDVGQSPEQLEGSVKSFGKGRESGTQGDGGKVEGVFGDSRPDRIDPSEARFEQVADEPQDLLDRESPEIRRVDPEELARTRVDQEDEIVARPRGAEGAEEAVLQPRVSKKGDESSQL